MRGRCILLYRIFLIFFSWLLFTCSSSAASIEDRLDIFPNWNQKPNVEVVNGDLYYPLWMRGDWQVTSTLLEQVAPLAPEILSPGFKNNQQYLNEEVDFRVRFTTNFLRFEQQLTANKIGQADIWRDKQAAKRIVADRLYNGTNIAKTYLGDDQVVAVKVDSTNPNKQITFLSDDRQLTSNVTGRASEQPAPNRFLTSEIANQIFKSPNSIYLNEVETTSDYHLMTPDQIEARQITAIYLSPQDPDYFKAFNKPVALYLYRLKLHKVS